MAFLAKIGKLDGLGLMRIRDDRAFGTPGMESPGLEIRHYFFCWHIILARLETR